MKFNIRNKRKEINNDNDDDTEIAHCVICF